MKYSKKLKYTLSRGSDRTKEWGRYLKAKKENPQLDFETHCKQLIIKTK